MGPAVWGPPLTARLVPSVRAGRGVCVEGPGELLHYANLIILSDIIDVHSLCEIKFGRWSVEHCTCDF